MVAPPCGERGLKSSTLTRTLQGTTVAPPCGERGLKSQGSLFVWSEYGGRSPSWGAWIEINSLRVCMMKIVKVAPPRGERGLKYDVILGFILQRHVAPPRGERGLKCHAHVPSPARSASRSPSWGAWIEICVLLIRWSAWCVAPPRGERGLKSMPANGSSTISPGRSPSWGAWIEILSAFKSHHTSHVAPPRGERGLKYVGAYQALDISLSLPLVGSVD